MELKEQLNERIDRWALLRHPFYRAWESGELPVAALQSYAREYGAFISQLPLGWEAVNDRATADEEREQRGGDGRGDSAETGPEPRAEDGLGARPSLPGHQAASPCSSWRPPVIATPSSCWETSGAYSPTIRPS